MPGAGQLRFLVKIVGQAVANPCVQSYTEAMGDGPKNCRCQFWANLVCWQIKLYYVHGDHLELCWPAHVDHLELCWPAHVDSIDVLLQSSAVHRSRVTEMCRHLVVPIY